MSHPIPRGGPPTRSQSLRSRGGRNRGKSQRARGSTRGHRIPPEYLAQVIAQREGRDPNDVVNVSENDLDEEEIEAFYAKFAARPLESNEAKYEEPVDEAGEEDHEEYDTNEVLARHQRKQRYNPGARVDEQEEKKKQKTSITEDDIDHALGASLRAISMKGGKHAYGIKGDVEQDRNKKKIELEWTPELEEMSREKAEAEAKSELKQRLKSSSSRGSSIKPRPMGSSVPHSNAVAKQPEMEDLEDYLDELLR